MNSYKIVTTDYSPTRPRPPHSPTRPRPPLSSEETSSVPPLLEHSGELVPPPTVLTVLPRYLTVTTSKEIFKHTRLEKDDTTVPSHYHTLPLSHPPT